MFYNWSGSSPYVKSIARIISHPAGIIVTNSILAAITGKVGPKTGAFDVIKSVRRSIFLLQNKVLRRLSADGRKRRIFFHHSYRVYAGESISAAPTDDQIATIFLI